MVVSSRRKAPPGSVRWALIGVLALSAVTLGETHAHLAVTRGLNVEVSAMHAPDCTCVECVDLRAPTTDADSPPPPPSVSTSEESSGTGGLPGLEAGEGAGKALDSE